MIRMEYLRSRMVVDRREQGVRNELGRMASQNAETYYFPVIQIDDRSQIYPFAPVSDMGEVARPDLTWFHWKISQKQIREVAIPVGFDIFELLASFSIGLDAENLHHPQYSFLVDFQMDGQPLMPVARMLA